MTETGQKAISYLAQRLQEPSTIRGIILMLTAAGVKISPDLFPVIISFGLFLAGFVGAILPDAWKNKVKVQPSEPIDLPEPKLTQTEQPTSVQSGDDTKSGVSKKPYKSIRSGQ